MPEYEPHTSEELGHEPTAVNVRAVSAAVVILLSTIVAALLLMAALSIYLAAVRGGEPTVRPPGTLVAPPPGVPSVDANQREALRQLRAREKHVLTEYAWIDRDEGVARIPIDRAMKIMVQNPFPTPEVPDEDTAAQ
jgi:hypothetical protein